MSEKPPPNERPVGPGNPPYDYRWQKGCPSPNPSGRPPNRKKRDMLKQLETFEETVLRVGAELSRRRDGSEITLAEAAILKVYERAFDKEKPSMPALKLVIGLQSEASAAADKLKSDSFEAAAKWKVHWTGRLAEARRRGYRIEDPVPHPDDILLHTDRSVQFVGPVTETEYAKMRLNLHYRNIIAEQLPLLEQNGEFKPAVMWAIYRRWQKLDKQVPPRLRKPWPSAVPSKPLRKK